MKTKLLLFVFLLLIQACYDTNFEPESTLFEKLANHLEKQGHSVKYINDSEIYISTMVSESDLKIEINKFFVSVNKPEQQVVTTDEMTDSARTKGVKCSHSDWYTSGEFTCTNWLCIADKSFEGSGSYECYQNTCYALTTSCHLTNN